MTAKKDPEPDVALDTPLFFALARGVNQAKPAVDFAGQGLLAFLIITNPPAGLATQCAAFGCGKTDMAMVMLPEVAELYEGGQILKAAAMAGKKGAEIVQKSGGATQALREFEALKGAETIKGTTRTRVLADGSKAVLYISSSGEEPTIAIQHASGTVTKFRY